METAAFYKPNPEPDALRNFWIPLALWIVFLAIDYFLLPGIFALHFLLLMTLVFLAFRLPAWMVAIWAVMYALGLLALSFLPFAEQPASPAYRPYIRMAVFLAGGTTAVLLANQRERLEKGHETLFKIISSLPLPVIVSDISGNILLLNHSAQTVLKNHVSELSGLSYFSTFVSPNDQGQAIAKYISYFDAGKSGPVPTRLVTRSAPSLTLHASVSVVSINETRLAVTVVERVE